MDVNPFPSDFFGLKHAYLLHLLEVTRSSLAFCDTCIDNMLDPAIWLDENKFYRVPSGSSLILVKKTKK